MAKPKMVLQKDDITCFLCQKAFRRKTELNMHREAVHEIDVQICKLCQKEFKNRKVLSTHLRDRHSQHTCKECKLDFESYKAKWHHIKAAHEETDRICNICGSMFEANYLMKRHMERTCSQRPLEKGRERKSNISSGKQDCPEGGYCEKCDNTFKTQKSFRMHKKLHTLSPTEAKCMICPAQYPYPAGLRRHYRNVHNVPKNHTSVLVPIIRGEGKVKKISGQRKACRNCGRDFNKTKMARHFKICRGKKEALPSVENILASALPLQSYIHKSTKYVEHVPPVKMPTTNTALENTTAHADVSINQDRITPQNPAQKEIALADICDVKADIATQTTFPDGDIQDVKGDQFYPEILYSSKSKGELAAELGLDDSAIKKLTRDQMLETLHEAILSELGTNWKSEEENQDNEENEKEELIKKDLISDWVEKTEQTGEKDKTTDNEVIDNSTNSKTQIEEPKGNSEFELKMLESENEEQNQANPLVQKQPQGKVKTEDAEKKRKSIHACEHCEATFSNLKHLNKHKAKSHKNRATKHFCNICNKSFMWLEKHKKTIHGIQDANTKQRPSLIHPCEHCEASFSNIKHFNKHMARSHKNKAKKHICNICNNSFTWLEKHQKTIHGVQEKLFCDTCGKEFNYKMLLLNHVRNVHEVTNDQCDQCSKICKNKPALQKHIKYNHS